MYYVQVILPLRLGWEPWYSSSAPLSPGTRVRVALAGREYVAVVSRIGEPDIDRSRIQPVIGTEDSLEQITPGEIQFWHFIADYYLCTVGEVYKSVYPAGRTAVEERRSNSRTPSIESGVGAARLSPAGKQDLVSVLEALGQHLPVLVRGAAREALYASLVRRTLADGADVLLLRPGARKPGYVRLRELSRSVRSAAPTLAEGHRSLLFLPWRKLGLIIVDEEQDPSYKQDSAPRYNARDAAIALASACGAGIVLGSPAPSLESLYNVGAGRYLQVNMQDSAAPVGPGPEPVLIDITAERRKRGLSGRLPYKLMTALREAASKGKRILLLYPWPDWRDSEIEFREAFPDNRFKFARTGTVSAAEIARAGLVTVMDADALLSKGDFRSDERAFATLRRICSGCTGELYIVGRDLERPVFQAIAQGKTDISSQLLNERRAFGYPPFTRLVELRINDTNESRRAKMSAELSRRTGGLQVFLPKDKNLKRAKEGLKRAVTQFESEFHYTGHIIIDVDP